MLVKHLPYREFKKIPGEQHYAYYPEKFREIQRKNPGKKFWLAYSLGSSFHDPQGMAKIVVGDSIPDSTVEIRNEKDYRKAWDIIVAHELKSFALSRNSER
jgi:hypothetical protein